jgi:hypothetical protein
MSEQAAAPKPDRVRKWLRLHPDTVQRVQYWSAKRELTEQEFYEQAVEEKIARMNGDYDLPTLEILRLNQLVDEMKTLSTNVANLERVSTTGFDSLLGLTRGDSYLLDDENGELSIRDTASAVAGG